MSQSLLNKWFWTIPAGPLCLLLLCTLLLPSSAIASERVLTIGNAGEPQTLDPHRYNLRLEETLLNDLFLGLTTFSAAGEIVPGAARSWQTSEDGLTWTFTLRDNLKWSDGTALTAEDFVYAARRLQDPATAASLAYFMYMVKNAPEVNRGELPVSALGVSAPDASTFVIELSRPYPYLLERLLYPTAFPVPQHVIQRHGENWVKPENWVSNGAYTLADWQPQAFVAMQANPNFYAPATISNVRYLPVVNEQSAYNRFRNNELHVIGGFPVGELARVKANYADELHLSDLLSMMYLVFNTQKAPFDDVRIRQALSLAIDQDILTDKVLRSGNKPAYSFVPNLIADYTATSLPHIGAPRASRLQQARALLAQAGYGPSDPLRITLRHVSGAEGKKVNLAITGMWREIGVVASLQQAELRNHFADLRQGDFDVAWAGWVGENNAEHYLTLLQSDIGNVNYGRFADEKFDDMIRTAQQLADAAERNAQLAAAEAYVVDFYPVVPLYTVSVRRLVSQQISGWENNLRDVHQVRYLRWTE
ncbi:MAG: peptide ABC transporter substrate-binding protein [bacterium]